MLIVSFLGLFSMYDNSAEKSSSPLVLFSYAASHFLSLSVNIFFRYKVNLQEAEKAGIKKGLSTGFAFALFNSVLFGCMALGFW